ncbi:MAG: hypothetical protein RLZ10_1879 [Bacteroidota bacterium]|jgi:hypothetical protein
MLLNEEIDRIKNLMNLSEDKKTKNIFKDFDTLKFKNTPPPSDNSEETKKEIKYLKSIDLKKRLVQEKDDITGNFIEFLKTKNVDEKKLIYKLNNGARTIILDLKNHYKRPRPFRLDPKLTDPMLKSMEGFAYPSGHSTQSNLIYLVLSHKYPKYKQELKKIKDDIVYSRQMAKAHYPSDIKFGEKLAKSLFNYLKDNDLTH